MIRPLQGFGLRTLQLAAMSLAVSGSHDSQLAWVALGSSVTIRSTLGLD